LGNPVLLLSVWSKYLNALRNHGSMMDVEDEHNHLAKWPELPIPPSQKKGFVFPGRDTCQNGAALAYVTGLVNQELPLENEYLAAEDRIWKARLQPGGSPMASGPHWRKSAGV
jgi:hypothetical protein